MVALQLQIDLAEELRRLTEHMRFSDQNGKEVLINVFEQNLPLRRTKDQKDYESEYAEEEPIQDPEQENVPFVIVRLDSGNSEDAMEAQAVKTILVFGLYDDSVEMQGYKGILNLFERICQRFRVNPVLNNKYVMGDKIEWALQDTDTETYPYIYGAMYMEWNTASVRREDPLT